jgi:hypothetical protein
MRSLQTWKVDILARLSHPAGEPLPLCSLECVTSCKLAYTAIRPSRARLQRVHFEKSCAPFFRLDARAWRLAVRYSAVPPS